MVINYVIDVKLCELMYSYCIFVNISIIHLPKYILIFPSRIRLRISSNFILSQYHLLKLKEVLFFQ